MKDYKVSAYIFLFSLILLLPLGASAWDLGTFGGVYLPIPSTIQQDAIQTLPCTSISIIISPYLIPLSDEILVTPQVQLTYTSHSIYYGPIYWKEFTTLLAGAEFTLHDKDIAFSLSALYGLQFKNDDRGFLSLGIIRTMFMLPITDISATSSLNALFPIEVEIRSDYGGIRIGAGIRYTFKGKHDE